MNGIDFENFIQSFSGVLRPFAISLTHNSEDANDLLQTTFYKALANREKFQEGTNLKAWLFTIMKNIFINDYRRKVKHNTIIDNTENLFYLNSSSSVDNGANAKFVMDDLKNAIDKLSDELRIPFLMHYEGFKYEEIGEQLRLPLGTVKSRIFFARKELKSRLPQYAPTAV